MTKTQQNKINRRKKYIKKRNLLKNQKKEKTLKSLEDFNKTFSNMFNEFNKKIENEYKTTLHDIIESEEDDNKKEKFKKLLNVIENINFEILNSIEIDEDRAEKVIDAELAIMELSVNEILEKSRMKLKIKLNDIFKIIKKNSFDNRVQKNIILKLYKYILLNERTPEEYVLIVNKLFLNISFNSKDYLEYIKKQ